MKNIMKQKKTTITASMVITMLVVTAMIMSKLMGFSFADNTFAVSSGKYIVTNEKNLTAQYVGASKKTVTSVNIPATVKINGQSYKVTSIKANALKGNIKVKKLTVGKNVDTIGKNAFYGCKNLKTVTINTTKLISSSVKAGAFKGLNSKAVVTVPEKKLASYKKILKAKGLTGKKQVVKGKKMEVQEEKKEEEEIDFNREIPTPTTMLSIDDYFGLESNIRETDSYSIGDAIPITVGFQMSDLMYGKWTTRTADGGFWIRCNNCKKMFDNSDDYYLSGGYEIDGCIPGAFNSGYDYGKPFTAWHWIPDDRACVATFHITLPEGLSYKDGTLKMFRMIKKEIAGSAYHVDVNGQDITVTIDNIKDASVHPNNLADEISVILDTELNSNATTINTVTASMSYDNGTGLKTVDIGNASVYSATMKFRNTGVDGNDLSGAEFALYKYKTMTSAGGVQYKKYVKVIDGIKGDACTITGLSGGKYRLVQIVAPAGYKKMENYEFNINMSASGGKLNSLSVDDNNKFPWEVDVQSGTISTVIINN